MRLGGLCSGVGGLELGIERATGAETVWHAENDPAPAKVLAAHWNVPNHGDITRVDWSEVEPVDVLAAGFPCQDISSAGKQVGIEKGARSGLWYEVARAVRDLRPRWVVVENVAALRRSPRPCGRPGLAIVTHDLAALGYLGCWGSFRSSWVGAPHRRERVFVVAADTHAPGPQRLESAPGRHLPAGGDREADRLRLLPTPSATLHNDGEDPDQWQARADRLREMHGNGNGAGTPLPVAIGRLLPTPRVSDTNGTGEHGAGGQDLRTALADLGGYWTEPGFWQDYEPAVRRWEHLHGPVPQPADGKRLRAEFPEWMMGYEPGWISDHLPRRPALKAAGNSVQPQVAELAVRVLAERFTVELGGAA